MAASGTSGWLINHETHLPRHLGAHYGPKMHRMKQAVLFGQLVFKKCWPSNALCHLSIVLHGLPVNMSVLTCNALMPIYNKELDL